MLKKLKMNHAPGIAARRVFEKASTIRGTYRLQSIYRYLGFALKHHAVRAVKRLPEADYSVDSSGKVHKYELKERAVFRLLANSRGEAANEFKEYLLEAQGAFEKNKENCNPQDVERVETQFRKFMGSAMKSCEELPERQVSNHLARMIPNARREVKIQGLGVADLVSDHEVIEIKKITQWKAAVGQVLVYGSHESMRGRNKVVYLFGRSDPERRGLISRTCEELGIVVRFHDFP